MSQFRLSGIRKYYEGHLALDLDYLDISPGQLHIITGPNGSGKSTLLNILAFLIKPDMGELVFQDIPVDWNPNSLQSLRTKVTLLQQSPFLFTGTVEYNVAFGLQVRAYDRSTRRSRVADALAAVGLPGFEPRNVKHLSGGERRRVALARSLALKPEVLLLDEAMAYVDRTTACELERVIYDLASAGTTVVMATHHLHRSDQFHGNIIGLDEGRLDKRH